MGCRGRREGRKEKFRSTKKENNSWKIGNEFIYYCWRQKLQLQESASKCLERTHGMEGRISLLQVGWWGHAYSLLLFCLCLEFLVLFRSRLLLTYSPQALYWFILLLLLLLSSSSKKQHKRCQRLKGFGLIAVSSHFRLLSDWWRNQSWWRKLHENLMQPVMHWLEIFCCCNLTFQLCS